MNLDKFIIKLKQKIYKRDIVVLLQGDLGSGKTTLVKNYVKSLGVSDEVTSPTFSLQSIYNGDIYHYDIYSNGIEEFIRLGLLEEFEKSGTHFVEWGDDKLKKILNEYGFESLTIKIKVLNNIREYSIET